jgi:hypothetical protein
VKTCTQFHELEWRLFAHEKRLALQRDENGFYVSLKTRVAQAAWVRRSEIENSSMGPAAYFDAAMQLASSIAYEAIAAENKELATKVAQSIQEMKIRKKEK